MDTKTRVGTEVAVGAVVVFNSAPLSITRRTPSLDLVQTRLNEEAPPTLVAEGDQAQVVEESATPRVARNFVEDRRVAAGNRAGLELQLRARLEAALPAPGAVPAAAGLIHSDRDWAAASPAEIRGLQTELRERGYSPGRVDGIWGPRTSGALTEAQNAPPVDLSRDWSQATAPELRALQGQLRDSGHDPGRIDGIWGPQTESALEGARAAAAETAVATPPAASEDAAAEPVEAAPAEVPEDVPAEPVEAAPAEVPEDVPAEPVEAAPSTVSDPAAAAPEVAAADPELAVAPSPEEDEEGLPDLDKLPSDLVLTGEDWSQATPERVRALQTALTDAGIDAGPIDGQWGAQTESGLAYARQAIEYDLNRSIYERQAEALPEPSDHPIVVESTPAETSADGTPRQIPEERRAALLSRDGDAWATAPAAEVEELQTFLSERGYQVGEVDGKWGAQTRGALELAQRRQRLLDGYSGADSDGADLARLLSPLPANMDNLLLSKLGISTAITDGSLSDEERLVIYDVAQAAIERTGDPVGGTSYADYGRPEFDDYFNRGNVTSDAVWSSFDDPQFRMASTVGRFTYMQDPEDPNRLFVFDGYDWNTDERNFNVETAGDDASRQYRQLRNDMRDMQRAEGDPTRDNRVFLVFDRAQMEALRAQHGG